VNLVLTGVAWVVADSLARARRTRSLEEIDPMTRNKGK